MDQALAISLVSLIGVLVLAGVMVWLYKSGKISANDISAVGVALDQVEQLLPDGSLMDKLIRNASEAVWAVEQLVKKGILDKSDDARKAKAIELTKQYAALDGVEVTEHVAAAIDTIIEAEVRTLPPTNPAV